MASSSPLLGSGGADCALCSPSRALFRCAPFAICWSLGAGVVWFVRLFLALERPCKVDGDQCVDRERTVAMGGRSAPLQIKIDAVSLCGLALAPSPCA